MCERSKTNNEETPEHRNQPDLKLSFAVVKKEECVFNKKQNKNHVVSFFVFSVFIQFHV